MTEAIGMSIVYNMTYADSCKHKNPWKYGKGSQHLRTDARLCLADCNNLLKSRGVNVVSMRACGGGSRSLVWRKIMAALYQCNICTLQQEEGPAYGAAILAGAGKSEAKRS